MNLDMNKCFDYGLITYNLIDYHRYLAAINANNPNLISPTNQLDPLSPLLIGLNLSASNANLPSSFPTLSNHPNNLFAVSPNLATTPNLLVPISTGVALNKCCKCKCGCDENNVQSTVASTGESAISSSYESSIGARMSYSGDEQTIRPPSPATAIKVPRAIRKVNDVIMKESSTRSPDNNHRLNIQALLPKLLDRTEKVFQKYCSDMSPATKAKIFNSKKSLVYQTLRPIELKEQICYFCKNNGEPDYLYKAHIVRDPITNKTICPVLRKYKCELCHASGGNSHTRSHCPLSKFIRQNCESIEAAKYFNMKILTSQHRKKQTVLNKLDKEIKESQQAKVAGENKENEMNQAKQEVVVERK